MGSLKNQMHVYYGMPVRYAEVELEEALKIAAELNVYAYDAYLIRCALRYAAPLLSLDRNLLHAARTRGVEVMEVSE